MCKFIEYGLPEAAHSISFGCVLSENAYQYKACATSRIKSSVISQQFLTILYDDECCAFVVFQF